MTGPTLFRVMTGWAWFGPYAHLLRGSEIVATFRGPGARRRALRARRRATPR